MDNSFNAHEEARRVAKRNQTARAAAKQQVADRNQQAHKAAKKRGKFLDRLRAEMREEGENR